MAVLDTAIFVPRKDARVKREQDEKGGTDYFPFQIGARFSAKALAPSNYPLH
jgi:hypothetical protein